MVVFEPPFSHVLHVYMTFYKYDSLQMKGKKRVHQCTFFLLAAC